MAAPVHRVKRRDVTAFASRWLAGPLLGMLALLIFLQVQHDLRGWAPPPGGGNGEVIQPTRPELAAFTAGECLPGSIELHDLPRSDEYPASASMEVFSCRSRSSTARFLLGYIAAALLVLTAKGILHYRR